MTAPKHASASIEFAHVNGNFGTLSDSERERAIRRLRPDCTAALAKRSELLRAGYERVVSCCFVDNYNQEHPDDPFLGVLDGSHDPQDASYRALYAREIGVIDAALSKAGHAADFYVLEKDLAVFARHYRALLTKPPFEPEVLFRKGERRPQRIYVESKSLNLETIEQVAQSREVDYQRAQHAGRAVKPPNVGMQLLVWDGEHFSCPWLAALWYAIRFSGAAADLGAVESGVDIDGLLYAPRGLDGTATAEALVTILQSKYLPIEAAARYLTLLTPWGKKLGPNMKYEFI